jgi:hypothetical protein
MPRKEFDAFTRLDASDVNTFLMDQSVMTFESSASRGSAIASPIEGMVTYLEDSNSLQLYDGTNWASTTGSGSGNAIINGAFEVNQRSYVSAANLASGVYGFDRWKSTFTNTTLTYTSAPQGQLVTINSGGSIEQVVERANLPAGTYTLSWSGTATGRVYNTGATPPSYASSPITVTLDGLANVEVEFTASGGTRTLGYVQLEPGTVANQFRRNSNTLQGELAACQRYYVRLFAPGSTQTIGIGMGYSPTSEVYVMFTLPVTMRAAVTSIDRSGGSLTDLVTGFTSTTFFTYNTGNQFVHMGMAVSGITAFRPYFYTVTTTGFVGFSAEL